MASVRNLYEGTRLDGPLEERCTVLIIGTGAGGPAAAYELAKAGIDTIMVEEGGWYPPEFYREMDQLESFKHLYRDYGMTSAIGKNLLKDPAVPFPLGKCVGGTTTVNSGTCFRTPDEILHQWQGAFGLTATNEELEPHYETVEAMLRVQPVPDEVLGNNARVFARGAEELGWGGQPLRRNAHGCKGSGRCVFGCPTDAKQGTHISYVPAALGHGARLYSDLRVEHILRDGERVLGAEGVLLDRETNRPKDRAVIRADHVIVACGAVGTPLLLQRNRLAPGNPNLGRHLRLHPGIRVAALFDEVINGWKGVPQGYYVDHFWQDHGIMFEGIFVPPGVALPILPGVGQDFVDLCDQYPHLAAFGAMIKDTSSGTVKAVGQKGQVIRYGLNRTDVKALVTAVKHACEVYFAAGARKVYPAIAGHMELDSPDEIAKIDPRKVSGQHLEMMAFHPMGTARMAADPERGVIDPDGRVFGTDNLYVADGSVFPSCLGVNPMESIMAFSARFATALADRISGS